METAQTPKTLHIRLTADLGRDGIGRITREKEHSGRIRKAAFGGRVKCFLIRLCISILNITLGPLFIWGIVLKSQDVHIIGLIIFGMLAFFLLKWIRPGIMMFVFSWAMLFMPIKRNDMLAVAKDFYDELDLFSVDYNRMHILAAPYAADKVPIKDFKRAWKGFAGSGSENRLFLPGRALEKLQHALRDARETICCSRCGAEKAAFRTALPWRLKAGETPFELTECPQCKAVCCGRCRSERAPETCPQCGGGLLAVPAFVYFEEQPAVWLERDSNKTASKNLQPVSIIEDLGDTCKKLEFTWNVFVRFDAPYAWSDKGKATGERPGDANSFPGILHVENYGVRIGKKWYLAQALPPEDCLVEWEERLKADPQPALPGEKP